MAKKNYTVKPQDNLLKLAEQFGVPAQSIQKANGINSLTAGQTIQIPSFGQVGGGLGLSQPTPYQLLTGSYNIAYTLPSGAIGQLGVSGDNEPYRGQPAAIGLYGSSIGGVGAIGVTGQNTPIPTSPGTPGTPPIGYSPSGSIETRVSGAGYTGFQTPNQSGTAPQLARGADTYIPPNTGIPQPTQMGTTLTPTNTLPSGYIYGSDPALDAQQRAVWNQQAGGSGTEQVRTLTRDEIWQRKAAQRQKNRDSRQWLQIMDVARSQGLSEQDVINKYKEGISRGLTNQQIMQEAVGQGSMRGNAVSTNLSWRVG